MRSLQVGDLVRKTTGYDFNGIIVSVFLTTAGLTHYVVELKSKDTGPVLHIFNDNQLELR